MKLKDLTAKAVKVRGLRLKGKTPEQTMAAIVYVDAKRETGDFVKLDRGLIGLRERDGNKSRST